MFNVISEDPFTFFVEHLVVELLLPFLPTYVCRGIPDLTHVKRALEGLQMWIYTRHLWQLSEGSLEYYTFCDTEHSFKMVIFETRDTHTCCRELSSGAGTVSKNKVCLGSDSNFQPNLGCR